MGINKLRGLRFGRLLVIEPLGKNNNGNILWKCICDCGNEKIANGSSLKRGQTRSCGCLAKETARKRVYKHGKSHTSEHYIWNGMRQRCLNPKTKEYKNYGGRGIKICDRWLGEHGFANFYADMGARPSSKHSLDRYPNNNGDYEPTNCRWATTKQQLRNTRINTWFESNGIKMVVTDWEIRWRIPKNAIQGHIRRGKTFDWIFNYYEDKLVKIKKPISQFNMNGDHIRTWENQEEAASQLGIKTSGIYCALIGKYNSYNNFKWEYCK